MTHPHPPRGEKRRRAADRALQLIETLFLWAAALIALGAFIASAASAQDRAGTTTIRWSTAHQARPGLIVRRAFVELHEGDLFLWHYRDAEGSAYEALLANGDLDDHRGRVEIDALPLVLGGQPLVLGGVMHDGTGLVGRLGRLDWRPRAGFGSWYMDPDRCPAPEALPLEVLQEAATAPLRSDQPTTGDTGSPRNIIGHWRRMTAAVVLDARGLPVPPRVLAQGEAWVTQQLEHRALFFYRTSEDESGHSRPLLRRALADDAVIGEHGLAELWGTQTLYGRPRDVRSHPRWGTSTAPWMSYDIQHAEAHRLWCMYLATGSELALLAADGVCQAVIGNPPFRGPRLLKGLTWKERAIGWGVDCLAMGYYATRNPDYRVAFEHAVASLELSQGSYGPWSWSILSPVEPGHLPVSTFMQGHLVDGLTRAMDSGLYSPRAFSVYRHAVGVLSGETSFGWARKRGSNTWLTPLTGGHSAVLNDRDPHTGEAIFVGSNARNGVPLWIAGALLRAAPYFPAHRPILEARAIAIEDAMTDFHTSHDDLGDGLVGVNIWGLHE